MDCYAYWSITPPWRLVAMTSMSNILRKQFEARLGEALGEHTEDTRGLVFKPRTRADVEAHISSNPGSTPSNTSGILHMADGICHQSSGVNIQKTQMP